MKALILAAGQGSRLRPLTDSQPKCLVELLGKSLLDRQADTLRACGVEEIWVAGGYRIDDLRRRGYTCFENERYESTNMVESLLAARPLLDDTDDLIISYGDIVYEANNLKRLLECTAEVCLMIDEQWRQYWEMRFSDPLTDAETLRFGDDDRIIELGRKPNSYADIEGQYTGLIKVRRDKVPKLVELYRSIDRSQTYDGQPFEQMYMTTFLQKMIDSGWQVKGVRVRGGWLEVDSVSDLQLYERLSKDGNLDLFCRLKEH